MVNPGELLINVVTENKRKVLNRPERRKRLGQKGKGSGMGAPNSPIADVEPPAERQNLTHAGTGTERGKLVGLPRSEDHTKAGRTRGKRAVRDADGPAGKGWAEKAKAGL